MASSYENGDLVDFVQFSAKPKKGKVPYYLLAAQVRKRFLEQPLYNWHRQVKGAALTGNPEKFIEIYRLRSPRMFAPALTAMEGGPVQTQIKALVEKEEELETQRFARMDYLGDVIASELAVEPYLLHTTISLDSADAIDEFSRLKSRLLPIFAQHHLSLIVAGRKLGTDQDKPVILNVWYFKEVEEVEALMMRLSDNSDYFMLNTLGSQDQHIYRNVSRHYQFFPLLNRPRPSSAANV